jgi:hypothetical protein
MLFMRYVLARGRALIREAVDRADLRDEGLRRCSAMLIGLRGGAENVIRAVVRFGTAQEVSFGLPAALLGGPAPPPLAAFCRDWPGHLFTVSAGADGPLAVSLLVPAPAPSDDVALVTGGVVGLSGPPGLVAESGRELQEQTRADILANRPALATVVVRPPPTDEQLADLLGFTQYFGAAVLLEHGKPAGTLAQAPPAPPAEVPPIPFARVTLEQVAELNRRSCLILTGMAPGSRRQAQAFDDWLESYRGPQGDVMGALLAPGRKIEVDLFTSGKAYWTELPDGPHRFVATFNTVSCYFIPRDAAPVPDIPDYTL